MAPTEGVHLILSPSASPEGFGTSPFGPLRGQKGEASWGDTLFLAPTFTEG